MRAIAGFYLEKVTPTEIAMYWDHKYAERFEVALMQAQEEMP